MFLCWHEECLGLYFRRERWAYTNSLVLSIKISFDSCSSVNNTAYLSILLISIIIYTELFQLFFNKKDIKDFFFKS